MARTLRALAVAAALVAVPSFAQAQTTLGPTIAYHNDYDFGVGAVLALPLEAVDPAIGVLADFIIFFPEGNVDYFEVNGNLTYDFAIEDSSVVPFALAGLNVARRSVDVGGFNGSNTEMGLNLGGGVKFIAGSLRPMVGLRLEIEGGDGFVIFGSLPFAFGT
jgi:hypothetical protein